MAHPPDLVPMTCQNCGKKIAEVKIKDGTVSVKCNKCGVVNTISTASTQSATGR